MSKFNVFFIILLLSASAAAQEPPPSSKPADSLAPAIDQKTSDARAKAAAALAARPDSLEDWLAAARAFGKFNNIEPGVHKGSIAILPGKPNELYEVMSYVPTSYSPGRPTALLLAFHGSGGHADEMIEMWRPTAETHGFIVAANTEPLAKNGYTFDPQEREAALGLLRYTRRIYNIDENNIFCTGVSRGGHLTWDVALRYPGIWAAIFPMIGGPWAVPAKDHRANLRYLPSILNLPIRDLQGAKDDPGLIALLHYAFKKLKEQNAKDAEYIEFPDLGHSFKMNAVEWGTFMKEHPRDPIPKRVIVTTVKHNDAGRSNWAEITGVGKDITEDFTPKLTQAEANTYNALDPQAKAIWWSEQAEKRTAKLEVTMDAPGQFTAKGTGVTKFRLLLTEEMFDPKKPVSINFNGKTKTFASKPDKKVFLSEFVERFDRTFLPVAEARVE